jgi:predicted nucleic acid-binding protein
VRFWDSSALVALEVEQAMTARVRELFAADSAVMAWVLSDVEVLSALRRLERERAITSRALRDLVRHYDAFWDGVHVIDSVGPVRTRARRLLGVHPLRAADAIQLAAALTATYDDPRAMEFACLDERLSAAAEREGFTVVP